jgi:hypothetical protein
MTDNPSLELEEIRKDVRALLLSNKAEMLSNSQYEELESLEVEVTRLCERGDEEGALATKKIIWAIIYEGPTGGE